MDVRQYISLGGILGTVAGAVFTLVIYLFSSRKFNPAILAGSVVTPGFYSFRFILAGRGHDATEFQEAQSALGLSYPGHFFDWVFLLIFLSGVVVWIIKSKPGPKIFPRLVVGFILTLVFVIAYQTLNNSIFDPLFQPG